MADKAFNAYKMAQNQFDKVADLIGLDSGTRELLRQPQREYHFTIPVKMFFRDFVFNIIMHWVHLKVESVFTRKKQLILFVRLRCG